MPIRTRSSVDEFGLWYCGPIMDEPGSSEAGSSSCRRPTGRSFGVRHMLAFYDVHADVLGGAIYLRKGGEEFLHFLQELRKPYPALDGALRHFGQLSPHRNVKMSGSRQAKPHRDGLHSHQRLLDESH